ncbi:MAG: hypothetical protein C7B43_14420 [Sulfobacillus benefaciens]|uniref:Uncharacterized protein n=1 Tax=Sulfobacillus benefaciens TaxID=453960 RepID=A0A2T2WVH3_9FIRM|nr:MAG: hypothetical protein C7B43_14420 [Sulfobacillus benefaciens]
MKIEEQGDPWIRTRVSLPSVPFSGPVQLAPGWPPEPIWEAVSTLAKIYPFLPQIKIDRVTREHTPNSRRMWLSYIRKAIYPGEGPGLARLSTQAPHTTHSCGYYSHPPMKPRFLTPHWSMECATAF